MALSSLDDKLLGEKVNYYVSSDEEDDIENSDEEQNEKQMKIIKEPKFIPTEEYNGKTVHTGPKGVMEDWRRYKQLEVEQKQKDEKERLELCKKLALTCRSNLDEENAKKKEILEADDEEDTDFMEWYKQKRIAELQQKLTNKWSNISFGKVEELKHSSYIEAIENEKPMVTVLIHIYEDDVEACRSVNGCFNVLAEEYKYVKFCKITASEARVSTNFKHNALPAILAYKDNLLIGNYVRISDTLTDDFFATDLEQFLNEYGLLTSKFVKANSKESRIITGPAILDSDSE